MSLPSDYQEAALTRRQALFLLLRDGRTHTQVEMARVAGHRYSARIQECHWAGLHYERITAKKGDRRVLYRQVPESRCTVCTGPRRLNAKEEIRQLKAQVQALKARVEELSRGQS